MITKQTVWLIHCPGCIAEYGGRFTAEQQAREYLSENPLCPNCDGENY
jgi:hypothetical protein